MKCLETIYEAASIAMRYWFVAAGVIVLIGVIIISLREYREKSYVLSLAKSSIGYLSVISGPADVMGENIQLMQKNAIGRSRRCDIMFDERSLDKTHASIYRALSGAVYLSRSGKGEVTVNGRAIESRVRLHSKDTVCFGNVVTKVHLKEEG